MPVTRLVVNEAMAENINLSNLPTTFSPSFLPYVPTLRQKQRALSLNRERYIYNIKLSKCGDHISAVARCYRSQRKTANAHSIHLTIAPTSVTDAHCNCKAG